MAKQIIRSIRKGSVQWNGEYKWDGTIKFDTEVTTEEL